jgi:glycosyltransferase involved in cell wall biosynthesis
MKILFNHSIPFSLAHGGCQTLIEALMSNLVGYGLEVEPLKWWDEHQRGDIMHFIGRPNESMVALAKAKNYRLVLTEFLDMTAQRSNVRLAVQGMAIRLAMATCKSALSRMGWNVYSQMDAIVYALAREASVARWLFRIPAERTHIIPHGLEESALDGLRQPALPGNHLLCLGTIDPRKNQVLLAKCARKAQVPIMFAGKPYSEQCPYFRQFLDCVDNKYVFYQAYVSEPEKQCLLKSSKGFVLLSQQESGCIAVYEAAASGLPMLLSDLPWARSYEHRGNIVHTALKTAAVCQALEKCARTFARQPGNQIFPVFSWLQIAGRYADLYKAI